MTETIWKNGLTQIVRFTALATDYTDFTGETTGDELPGAIVVYSENRASGWVDQVIDTPVVLWNAENVAIWEAEIPASYITLYRGNATLQVSGTGMKMITIPLIIGETGGGNTSSIIPHGSYTIDKDAKTITLDDTSITISQIEEIFDISRQARIWDPTNSKRYIRTDDPDRNNKLDIRMESPGVITYEADLNSITNDDILQIKVKGCSAGFSPENVTIANLPDIEIAQGQSVGIIGGPTLTPTSSDLFTAQSVSASSSATCASSIATGQLSKLSVYCSNSGASTDCTVTIYASPTSSLTGRKKALAVFNLGAGNVTVYEAGNGIDPRQLDNYIWSVITNNDSVNAAVVTVTLSMFR